MHHLQKSTSSTADALVSSLSSRCHSTSLS